MAVKTTTITGLEERQRVADALRRREHELRARGLTRLALFGSTARGDMGPESDLDLLIEVDSERGFGLFAFLDLKDDLARLLGRPVDLAFPDAMRPQPAHGRAARRSRGVLIAAPRDPRIVLEQMLEAIVDIEQITAGRSFEAYAADRLTRRAVERCIEIVSEASRGHRQRASPRLRCRERHDYLACRDG